MTQDEFRNHLRKHKLKATRQRLAVHDVMMDLGHASADMVREELVKRGSHVTTASVYNILAQLADDELQSLVYAHLKRRRFKGYTVEDIDIQFVARPTRKNKNV